MKILFAASEVVPFAKTGGLADVAAGLPAALRELGHDVRVIMPKYRSVDVSGGSLKKTGERIHASVGDVIRTGELFTATLPSGVPVYLVRNDHFFDRDDLYGTSKGDYPDNASRFIFFSRAILDAMKGMDFWPDVLHLNDWQTGLAALYLKTYQGFAGYDKVASLFTIHNLGYQGLFWHYDLPLTGVGWDYFTPEGIEFYGKVSFLKAGLIYADGISTVSRKYAREMQTREFGFGLEGVLQERSRDLSGILNGVDYDTWDPATDPLIPAPYSSHNLKGKKACKKALLAEFGLTGNLERPLIGCVSRLTSQKGFDLIAAIEKDMMEADLAMVVLGTGDEKYERFFSRLSKKYPGRVGVKITYDNRVAHLIEAGSDLFLMPSRYEPCGLNQMYSLKYGAVPIVRATGGLDDTVINFNPRTRSGNGFKFAEYSPKKLSATLRRALRIYRDKVLWKDLVKNAMECDFSWSRPALEYEKLYSRLVKKNRKSENRASLYSGKVRP
jgi:starch synthase